MKKIYYRYQFKLKSALNIGCGTAENTDKDIIMHKDGRPYIPGTSMAGVFRNIIDGKKDNKKSYFGYNKNAVADDTKLIQEESHVITYDAEIISDTYIVSERDCVALDQNKTAVYGSKYDFQILESDIMFVTYFEQDIYDNSEYQDDIGMKIAQKWKGQQLSFGSKTTRGLGQTEIVSVKRKMFDFSCDTKSDNEITNWLDFDVYDESEEGWGGVDEESVDPDTTNMSHIQIEMLLAQNGAIAIRRYTTDVSTKNNTQPDYEQLSYKRDNGEHNIPVIPGTSWAGAFKHHMEKIMPGCTKHYFGKKKDTKNEHKGNISYIQFGDSEISNAIEKKITRNAIDRFTNEAVNKSLYTERTFFNGETRLCISLNDKTDDDFIKVLAASIVDLNEGILSVGGLTSVGRGLFTLKNIQINGKPVFDTIKGYKAETLYTAILDELRRCADELGRI